MNFRLPALLLPVLASSCIYSDRPPPPFSGPRPLYPPYRDTYRSPEARPYEYPQGQRRGDYYDPESGTYEQVPPQGGDGPRGRNSGDTGKRRIPPSFDPESEGSGSSSGSRDTGNNGGSRQTDYPVARKTDRPNVVISPYEPYNEIDVSEGKSGQLMMDPSDPAKKNIFRVP